MPVTNGSRRKPQRLIRTVKKPKRDGPPIRQRALFGQGVPAIVGTDLPGPKPPQFLFDTEWRVWWYLTVKEKLKPDLEFTFQSSADGGRMMTGGIVADFIVRDRFEPGLVLNPIGFYWHRLTTALRAEDLREKARLTEMGFTVVYIREEDLVDEKILATMRAAMLGVQLFEGGV